MKNYVFKGISIELYFLQMPSKMSRSISVVLAESIIVLSQGDVIA